MYTHNMFNNIHLTPIKISSNKPYLCHVSLANTKKRKLKNEIIWLEH